MTATAYAGVMKILHPEYERIRRIAGELGIRLDADPRYSASDDSVVVVSGGEECRIDAYVLTVSTVAEAEELIRSELRACFPEVP